ncbi:hypothetical protein KC614_03460 [candidate division WWE3 bacterium]|uniref:Glycoside hydrolase family 57 N-terminal domain-containing protein n=1 Tax=candidate division WWE3 bacterium TaxID=2053526 RepID=A0A955RS49_UNCKA|nr:hypothetical protein [candidate division WWE3 bacterium]
MRIALVLHAHQPPTQYPEVTSSIAQKSYIPIFESLTQAPKDKKITINLTRSLIDQLYELRFDTLLDKISQVYNSNNVELTTTSAYHALVPHLTEGEISRQVRLQNEALSQIVGEKLKPAGMFLPELRYSYDSVRQLDKSNVKWVLLDESAYPGVRVDSNEGHEMLSINRSITKIEGTSIVAFFRDRPMSFMVAFDHTLTLSKLVEILKRHFSEEKAEYVVVAVDMETFGYHYYGNINLFNQILESDEINLVSLSDILELELPVKVVKPHDSTWGMAEEHGEERVFPRWENPENVLHQIQWELFNMALRFGEHKGAGPDVFDKCLHSDQFWWAGGNPCWHPGMVESGAKLMLETIKESAAATEKDKQHAELLVGRLVEEGLEIYGDEVINC